MNKSEVHLSSRVSDGVLHLRKENAATLYGVTVGVWAEMMAAFDRAARDPAIRAVVIDAGGRGFHFGAVMVAELKPAMAELTAADIRDLIQRGQALGRQIAALPKPVIGIARGGALGGGLETLLRCDFIYTRDDAEFSLPEVTLGYVAAWGGIQWCGRLMSFRRAQEFLLLGEKMSGRDAAAAGLVTRSFASDQELDKHLDSVLGRLRLCSPTSFAQSKKCLHAVWQGPVEYGERIDMEAEVETMTTGDFLKANEAWSSSDAAYDFVAEKTDTTKKSGLSGFTFG